MEAAQDINLRDKITVTLADAAKLTGIGRAKLEELAKGDIKFPSFKVGVKTLIHVELLNKYLAEKATMRVGEKTMSKRVAEIKAKREERE